MLDELEKTRVTEKNQNEAKFTASIEGLSDSEKFSRMLKYQQKILDEEKTQTNSINTIKTIMVIIVVLSVIAAIFQGLSRL